MLRACACLHVFAGSDVPATQAVCAVHIHSCNPLVSVDRNNCLHSSLHYITAHE